MLVNYSESTKQYFLADGSIVVGFDSFVLPSCESVVIFMRQGAGAVASSRDVNGFVDAWRKLKGID